MDPTPASATIELSAAATAFTCNSLSDLVRLPPSLLSLNSTPALWESVNLPILCNLLTRLGVHRVMNSDVDLPCARQPECRRGFDGWGSNASNTMRIRCRTRQGESDGELAGCRDAREEALPTALGR